MKKILCCMLLVAVLVGCSPAVTAKGVPEAEIEKYISALVMPNINKEFYENKAEMIGSTEGKFLNTIQEFYGALDTSMDMYGDITWLDLSTMKFTKRLIGNEVDNKIKISYALEYQGNVEKISCYFALVYNTKTAKFSDVRMYWG